MPLLRKRCNLFIGLLLVCMVASAQPQRSLAPQRARLLYSIGALGIDSVGQDIYLSFDYQAQKSKGRYILQEGNTLNAGRFMADGVIVGNRMVSRGYASYSRSTVGGQQWLNVYHLLAGNPYQIADSSVGKSYSESYRFGGLSTIQLLPNLYIGGFFDYQAGTAYRTVDPRPYSQHFNLEAGINLQLVGVRWNAGVDVTLGYNAENISIQMFESTYKVLLMRMVGLDRIDFMRSVEATSEAIKYVGRGGNISINGGYKTDIGVLTMEAQLERWTQDQQQSMQVTPYSYELTAANLRLLLEHTFDRSVGRIELSANMSEGKGTEHTYVKVPANTSTSLVNEIRVASSKKYSYTSNRLAANFSLAGGRFATNRYWDIDVNAYSLYNRSAYASPHSKLEWSALGLDVDAAHQLKIKSISLIPKVGAGVQWCTQKSKELAPPTASDGSDPKDKFLVQAALLLRDGVINDYSYRASQIEHIDAALFICIPFKSFRMDLKPAASLIKVAGGASTAIYRVGATFVL